VSERVRSSFDRIAEQYAADFADELTGKPYDRERLRDFAARCGRGPVLDVGCGPAAHVGRFVADLGARVIGVDLAPRSLTVARRLNDPSLALVAADVRALPFASGSCAGALAFYSLIYEADPSSALVELRRVLRDGGALLVAVHAGQGFSHHSEYKGQPVDVGLHLQASDVFAERVKRAGFRLDNVEIRPPYPFEHATERLYVAARATVLPEPSDIGASV
jgi:SAM-dependent methyltransferase